jgi:hypothetical protein
MKLPFSFMGTRMVPPKVDVLSWNERYTDDDHRKLRNALKSLRKKDRQ